MRRRDAFTLIELLMVVLVVGILASVAIPTYSGQRDRAEAAAATSNLETVLRSARAEHTKNDGSYPAAATVAAAAQDDNPGFAVDASSNFTPGVQVEVPTSNRVVLRTRAARQQANEMIVDDRTPGAQQTARLHGYQGDPTGLSAITNETINPNLESGTLANWNPLHNHPGVTTSTLSLASTGCREGRYCARIDGTGGTGVGAYIGQMVGLCNTSCSPAQQLQLAAVAPGDNAAVRCSIKVLSGQIDYIGASMHLFDAGGNKVGGYRAERIENPEVGRWYDLGGVTDTVTEATAVRATARVNLTDITGDVSVLVDRCMLVINPLGDRLPAYFDGGTGGGQWTGAANLSRSDGYLARRTSNDD